MDESQSRLFDGGLDDRICYQYNKFTEDNRNKKIFYDMLSSLAYWHDKGELRGIVVKVDIP